MNEVKQPIAWRPRKVLQEPRTNALYKLAATGLVMFCACLATAAGAANLGLAELPASAVSGPVTLFYPTNAATRDERRDGYVLQVAVDAAPVAGNRRLVVISHGSPGSPWGHADLARALVQAGFVVALPEHQADNAKDDTEPGPPAWRRRPQEVSRAIDRLAAELTYARLLDLDRVGIFGMSAGGHTALTLAGGRWSPSRLREHCERHIVQDFHACAGPSFELSDGWWGRAMLAVVGWVNDRKWNDTEWYGHTDPRIVAAVAGVPFAADFDPASFAAPVTSLALITARQDRWLSSHFHADAVLAACGACLRLADLEAAGHGALLSPMPPQRSARMERLIGDPSGFDRDRVVPALNARIADHFTEQLVAK